ncbi:MAG TPA: hypothetical protein PLB91_08460 [Spirochaetales bacterium]|nr:hypothetical protein [Spirochaetales bacterium]HRY54258.1 hypothetical protein [Spirochaetia bacterium]HRZ64003.1 hypothetical protein [Spirochaetia bacterium]
MGGSEGPGADEDQGYARRNLEASGTRAFEPSRAAIPWAGLIREDDARPVEAADTRLIDVAARGQESQQGQKKRGGEEQPETRGRGEASAQEAPEREGRAEHREGAQEEKRERLDHRFTSPASRRRR